MHVPPLRAGNGEGSVSEARPLHSGKSAAVLFITTLQCPVLSWQLLWMKPPVFLHLLNFSVKFPICIAFLTSGVSASFFCCVRAMGPESFSPV